MEDSGHYEGFTSYLFLHMGFLYFHPSMFFNLTAGWLVISLCIGFSILWSFLSHFDQNFVFLGEDPSSSLVLFINICYFIILDQTKI